MRVLLVATALLLFGHGALAVQGKAVLASHLTVAGLPGEWLPLIGWAEMCAALLLLASPSATLLVAIATWKLLTESLWVVSDAPIFEFIERGGSYAAPIALAVLLSRHPILVLTLKRTS